MKPRRDREAVQESGAFFEGLPGGHISAGFEIVPADLENADPVAFLGFSTNL